MLPLLILAIYRCIVGALPYAAMMLNLQDINRFFILHSLGRLIPENELCIGVQANGVALWDQPRC